MKKEADKLKNTFSVAEDKGSKHLRCFFDVKLFSQRQRQEQEQEVVIKGQRVRSDRQFPTVWTVLTVEARGMSKVTKTILILQLDSWIAAHSGASCFTPPPLSLQPPPSDKHIHAVLAVHDSTRWIALWGWVTTVTLPCYSPIDGTRVELHLVWENVPVPADGVPAARWALVSGCRVLQRLTAASLWTGTYLCPVLPSKQSVSCISGSHWPEVIATRRILPHCVGQERGGGAGAWSEYLEAESGWQFGGNSLLQTHILRLEMLFRTVSPGRSQVEIDESLPENIKHLLLCLLYQHSDARWTLFPQK